MLINLEAQVEVKVRPGSRGDLTNGQAMVDQLSKDLDRLLFDFMASRGQDPALYCFQVKVGTQVMKI